MRYQSKRSSVHKKTFSENRKRSVINIVISNILIVTTLISNIVSMSKISIDSYVLDTLMRDLVQHGEKPSAFIVYMHLWNKTQAAAKSVRLSHLKISDATGLSKSSVQSAI